MMCRVSLDGLLDSWRAAYARPVVGWDFSDLVGLSEPDPPTWYDAWAGSALATASSVLDMGTGGGEVLLDLASRHPLPADTTATEGWEPNVPVATEALSPLGIPVVWHDPESEPLPFDDGRFDLVLNRHEAYTSAEVVRVLRPGGRFVTQQVDGRSLSSMTAALGHTSAYEHVRLDLAAADAEAAGLAVEASDEWVGELVFTDVATVLGYLRMVPWEVPDDFGVDAYADALLAMHDAAAGEPLVFEQRRFILACRRRDR